MPKAQKKRRKSPREDYLSKIKKREESTKYKRERVRELLERNYTKSQFDELRERSSCMKEHPGSYCDYCRPETGSQDEKNSEEEYADLFDSWSDCYSEVSDLTRGSMTYDDCWAMEVEIRGWKKEEEDVRRKCRQYAAESVNQETQLKAYLMEHHKGPRLSNVIGFWDLWSDQDCAPSWYETRYYRLDISRSGSKHHRDAEVMLGRDCNADVETFKFQDALHSHRLMFA